MALVSYTDVAPVSELQGQLFAGKKFFLVQRLPTRSRFVSDVEANGGLLVRFEDQADYIIADHMRKDAPPRSLSYRFIEAAIRNGQIPSENDHRAGQQSSTVRSVGSRSIPGKSTRTPFTAEDDLMLWKWVQSAIARGFMVKGNEIYKQLEEQVRQSRGFATADDEANNYRIQDTPINPGVIDTSNMFHSNHL